MNVRPRKCDGIIDIAVFELFTNGLEDAYKPFPMKIAPSTYPESHRNHAHIVITKIREYVPNAKIHLMPPTAEAINYVIENKIPLVNMSLSNTYAMALEENMAKTAFLVTSAGNSGSKGETLSARKHFWCAVGAVDEALNPQEYSSWGNGTVRTVAIVDNNPVLGHIRRGTSFAAPIITGLLGQWYIWYRDMVNKYPSIKETNEFIEVNSHDIWDDGRDLRTGFGLLRLPHKFKITEAIINNDGLSVTKIDHIEGELSVSKNVPLSIPTNLINNKLYVGFSDISSIFKVNTIVGSDLKVIY